MPARQLGQLARGHGRGMGDERRQRRREALDLGLPVGEERCRRHEQMRRVTAPPPPPVQGEGVGRAAWRGRGENSGGGGSLKKKKTAAQTNAPRSPAVHSSARRLPSPPFDTNPTHAAVKSFSGQPVATTVATPDSPVWARATGR